MPKVPALVTALIAIALAVPGTASAAGVAPDGFDWAAHIAKAREVVPTRHGRIAFAVVDERGRFRGGHRPRDTFFSASVVKAMLLVCYLDHSSVRDRRLAARDRAILRPMVTRSDDRAANTAYVKVGPGCLRRLARRAGMPNFRTGPVWGRTHVNAIGVARLFWRIDRFVVPRHRPYARDLLAGVVPSQRWGVPAVAPTGWTPMFKGGFVGPAGDRIVNQGVLLQRGARRFSLAVLTHDNPTQRYGEVTIERIAGRLLRGYPLVLPDLVPPRPPRTLAAAASTPTAANLRWSGATDDRAVRTYRIFRNGEQVATVRAAVSTWHDPGLAPARRYRWYVRAVDAAGHASLPSPLAWATTPAA